MIAIPAIDVKQGACAQSLTTAGGAENRDVMEVARRWTGVGFGRLHVLDLDAGTGQANEATVDELLRDVSCDVQVAGSVDSTDVVRHLLDAGASHVVLADRALDDLDWLESLTSTFPGQLIVATDVKERRVNTRGWVRTLPVDVMDLVDELSDFAIAGILVLARHRQGAMQGTDLALMEDVAEGATVPVLAAGGVTTLDDLRALEHRGLSGAIIGTALYNGALDPRAVVSEFVED